MVTIFLLIFCHIFSSLNLFYSNSLGIKTKFIFFPWSISNIKSLSICLKFYSKTLAWTKYVVLMPFWLIAKSLIIFVHPSWCTRGCLRRKQNSIGEEIALFISFCFTLLNSMHCYQYLAITTIHISIRILRERYISHCESKQSRDWAAQSLESWTWISVCIHKLELNQTIHDSL